MKLGDRKNFLDLFGASDRYHKMHQPLVSVIIPAYNADRTIYESLLSVKQQTYQKWEIVVVEDGSISNTKEIVEKFSKECRTQTINYCLVKNNAGQANARNIGIEKSHGRYIALLDSDDIWLPTHLSSSLKLADQSQSEIIFSTALFFDDQTGERFGFWGPEPHELENISKYLADRSFITPSATLIRREVFDQIGFFQTTEKLRAGGEDYDFWLRAVIAGKKFTHLSGEHCLYRKGHVEAATHNFNLITKSMISVLESHLEQLPGLDEGTRKWLLARKYSAAGKSNLAHDPVFSRKAFAHAWTIRKLNIRYIFFFLCSFFPKITLGVARSLRRLRNK